MSGHNQHHHGHHHHQHQQQQHNPRQQLQRQHLAPHQTYPQPPHHHQYHDQLQHHQRYQYPDHLQRHQYPDHLQRHQYPDHLQRHQYHDQLQHHQHHPHGQHSHFQQHHHHQQQLQHLQHQQHQGQRPPAPAGSTVAACGRGQIPGVMPFSYGPVGPSGPPLRHHHGQHHQERLSAPPQGRLGQGQQSFHQPPEGRGREREWPGGDGHSVSPLLTHTCTDQTDTLHPSQPQTETCDHTDTANQPVTTRRKGSNPNPKQTDYDLDQGMAHQDKDQSWNNSGHPASSPSSCADGAHSVGQALKRVSLQEGKEEGPGSDPRGCLSHGTASGSASKKRRRGGRGKKKVTEKCGDGVSEDTKKSGDGVSEDTKKSGDGVSLDTKKSGDGVSLDTKKSGDGVSLDTKKSGDGVSLDTKKSGDGVSLDTKKSGDGVSRDTKTSGDGVSDDMKESAEDLDAHTRQIAKELYDREMHEKTKEVFPDLCSDTIHLPPFHFNKTASTSTSWDQTRAVYVQNVTNVSDVGCERAEHDVRRCLETVRDVTGETMVVLFNYSFDDYLQKKATPPPKGRARSHAPSRSEGIQPKPGHIPLTVTSSDAHVQNQTDLNTNVDTNSAMASSDSRKKLKAADDPSQTDCRSHTSPHGSNSSACSTEIPTPASRNTDARCGFETKGTEDTERDIADDTPSHPGCSGTSQSHPHHAAVAEESSGMIPELNPSALGLDHKRQFPKPKNLFSSPDDLNTDMKRGDFDALIISPRLGFTVVETKAVGYNQVAELPVLKRKVEQAVKQLFKQELVLRHLFSDLGVGMVVRKVVAVPNVTRQLLTSACHEDEEFDKTLRGCVNATSTEGAVSKMLCADDMIQGPQLPGHTAPGDATHHHALLQWWRHLTKGDDPVSGDDTGQLEGNVYERIVARLTGPYSKVRVENIRGAAEARTVAQCVHLTGLRYGRNLLRGDQIQILDSPDPFVYLTGPPGSGKTLVLGTKGVEWARQGDHVVVLMPQEVSWGSLISLTLYQRIKQYAGQTHPPGTHQRSPSPSPSRQPSSGRNKRKPKSFKKHKGPNWTKQDLGETKAPSNPAGEEDIPGSATSASAVQAASDLQPSTSDLPYPSSDLQPSTSGLQPPTSDLQPSTSGLQPSTSDLQPSTSDLQPSTSGFQSPTSDLQPSTSGLQSPTSDLQPSTSDLRSSASDLQSDCRDIYRVHTGTIQRTEDTQKFVRDLLCKYSDRPLRIIVDEGPTKANLNYMYGLLKGAHKRMVEGMERVQDVVNGWRARGQVVSRSSMALTSQPCLLSLAVADDVHQTRHSLDKGKGLLLKVNHHLQAVRERLEGLQPPHGRPAITQNTEWKALVAQLSTVHDHILSLAGTLQGLMVTLDAHHTAWTQSVGNAGQASTLSESLHTVSESLHTVPKSLPTASESLHTVPEHHRDMPVQERTEDANEESRLLESGQAALEPNLATSNEDLAENFTRSSTVPAPTNRSSEQTPAASHEAVLGLPPLKESTEKTVAETGELLLTGHGDVSNSVASESDSGGQRRHVDVCRLAADDVASGSGQESGLAFMGQTTCEKRDDGMATENPAGHIDSDRLYDRPFVPADIEELVQALDKLEAGLMDASGLLFNVETQMYFFVVSDVLSLLVTERGERELSVWSSGVTPFYPYHHKEEFVVKPLTHCVRCPPTVQRVLAMVEKDMKERPSYNYRISSLDDDLYPLPTDGPEVKLMNHRGHMNKVKEILDCRECGDMLADYLIYTLHLDGDSGLKAEDVAVGGSLDISCLHDRPFLQAVVDKGLQPHCPDQGLTSPPPYPGKILFIGGCAFQGLENKVVVFMPDVSRISDDISDVTEFRPDLPDWLKSMGRWNRCHLWFVASRCLSQLVSFHV